MHILQQVIVALMEFHHFIKKKIASYSTMIFLSTNQMNAQYPILLENNAFGEKLYVLKIIMEQAAIKCYAQIHFAMKILASHHLFSNVSIVREMEAVMMAYANAKKTLEAMTALYQIV